VQDYEYQVAGDEGSETEYENARDANSSGVSTPQYAGAASGASPEDAPPAFLQQAANAAAAPDAGDGGSKQQLSGEGAAPRGLPGLPARPRGPTLPPRPGAKPAGGGGGGSSSEPTGEREAPATGTSTTGAAAAPQLPPRPAPASQLAAAPPAAAAAPAVEESEKVKKVRRQVQSFRTNIFRAALRLRYPTRSAMLQQLMYRLNMAERIHLQSPPGAGPQDPEGQAQMDAERAEVLHEPMDFSCTVLVLGLSGVGKTTTLQNLLGMEPLSGYHPTDSVQVLRGEVSGIPITFIDTPGLQAGPGAMAANLKKLHACKRAWNKHKPHAVLYLDRMDHGRRDQADLPVMRAVTEVLGPDVWFSTVLTLTHAGAPPPDGP
jgi:AIG1 family